MRRSPCWIATALAPLALVGCGSVDQAEAERRAREAMGRPSVRHPGTMRCERVHDGWACAWTRAPSEGTLHLTESGNADGMAIP